MLIFLRKYSQVHTIGYDLNYFIHREADWKKINLSVTIMAIGTVYISLYLPKFLQWTSVITSINRKVFLKKLSFLCAAKIWR